MRNVTLVVIMGMGMGMRKGAPSYIISEFNLTIKTYNKMVKQYSKPTAEIQKCNKKQKNPL